MVKRQFLWKLFTLAALALLAGGVALLYVYVLKPRPAEGLKTVTFSVAVRAETGGERIEQVKSFRVMTEAGTLGALMRNIDEEAGLRIPASDYAAGYITTACGYTVNFDRNGEFFCIYADTSQTNPSFGEASLNGETLASAAVGIDELNLADGASYLFARIDNDTAAVWDIPVTGEIFDGSEADAYRENAVQARNLLVTVLAVAGTAFIAVCVLTVTEAVRARRA